MKIIYKYELPIAYDAEVQMPAGAQVLCVQTQNEVPHLWAIVDPTACVEKRHFRVLGTGQPFATGAGSLAFDDEPLGSYIGTFQLQGGRWVFHAFEKAKV